LKVKSDVLPLDFAFSFNLRRCNVDIEFAGDAFYAKFNIRHHIGEICG